MRYILERNGLTMQFFKGLGLCFLATLTASCGGGSGKSSSSNNGPITTETTTITPATNPASPGSSTDGSGPSADASKTPSGAISLSVVEPKDVLYIQGVDRSRIYLATGNGGVGASDSTEDTLTEYAGIPVALTGAQTNAVQLNVTGDSLCKGIYSFDANSSLIKIDAGKVLDAFEKTPKLTVCNIQVQATGNEHGKAVTVEKSFVSGINFTLDFYQSHGDLFTRGWTSQYLPADIAEILGIANWIKTKTSVEKISTAFKNLDSLTAAKNITSIDLSGTSVVDIRALQFLPKLKELNLSNTKISGEMFANLASLQNLTKLTIRNANLQNLKPIVNNLKNLTYLDVSENQDLNYLNQIENLKYLKTLIASNIGLKENLNTLKFATSISELDISSNDLSGLSTLNDPLTLAGLFNLNSLNVSNSKISDEFLKKYFSYIEKRDRLKKFVNRNNYLRSTPGNCVYNRFSDSGDQTKIVKLPPSLTELDIHGNSCYLQNGTEQGVTNLDFLDGLPKLEILDISNNAIIDVQKLNSLVHVKPENLTMGDLGTSSYRLKKTYCIDRLGKESKFAQKCDQFPNSEAKTVQFTSSGTYVVPTGATSATITGCSAGDGGQGGQGGQGGFAVAKDYWINDGWIWRGGSCEDPNTEAGSVCRGLGFSTFQQSPTASLGDAGAQGGISSVQGLYSSNQATGPGVANGLCQGGTGGKGGQNGAVTPDRVSDGFIQMYLDRSLQLAEKLPQNGQTGATGNSKAMSSATVSVTPGQTLTITLGTGGRGGNPSSGTAQGGCGHQGGTDGNAICGLNGDPGIQGNPGSNGYIEITFYQ